MIPPITHMNNARPTDPELERIVEGVAKILSLWCESTIMMTDGARVVAYPVPMMRLKMRNTADHRPIVRLSGGTSSKVSPSRPEKKN